MIEVKYKERLGNNLFQYCLGRILAKEKGYALKADPIKGFFGTYEKIDGSNEIYFPITKEGVWSEKKGIDLKVYEERYKYIQVNSKYVPNFAEKFYNFKRINLHKVRLFINDIKKNIFLNKKIYPAFVINLKKYEDRRKNIEKEFQKIDQIPTFIEALNGHDKNFPFPKYKSLFYFFWGNKQSFKPGAFACYLSHAKVWEKVVLQKETAALVLEDDVRINKENYAKFINEKLPDDFDVIFLNNRMTAWLGFIPKRKEQLPSFTKVSKELINILLNNGYPNNLIPSGADAYLISKKGAKKLLQMMQEKKICMGVDYAIIFNSLSKSDLEDINFIQKDKIPQTLLFFLETELNTPLGKTKINLESYIYTKGPVFSTTDFSSTIMHEVFINNSVFEKMTDNQ